ncbi:MAG TPA: hypothetical protein P5132_06075 [Bacteroidales bacterium]|nr:hypothetical protein [Bacteroidales bacterium]
MEEQNVQTTTQRPTFLTVLCILTFIGSGLGLLFGIIGLVAAGAIESVAAYLPVGTDSGIFKSIITLILIAGSLYGAIQMWKLKKLGFYIYAAANVILLILNFGIFGLIITAAFIIMYYLNLKVMV